MLGLRLKMKSLLRIPFVTTVAAGALACGSVVTEADTGSTMGAGGNNSNSNSVTTGSGGSGQTSGSGGSSPNCPTTAPQSWDECTLQPGEHCSYDFECQSGDVTVEYECDSVNLWSIKPQDCGYHADSCPGTELYCSGQWLIPQGTNPPSPCPVEAPAEGESCFVGMGGTWEQCGYLCGGPNSIESECGTCQCV